MAQSTKPGQPQPMRSTISARPEPLRHSGLTARNTVLRVEAHLLAREGRFEEAFEKHDEADAICADLGMTVLLAVQTSWPGELLLQLGRPEEAVERMRLSVARLEELGDRSFRSTSTIRLADALFEAGELVEAEERAIEGEQLGAAEDVVNYAYGRGVRARIAVARGETDDALALARDALRYAYETDFPAVHAVVHRTLADALAAAGRRDEAAAELERAIERFESYGNVFEADRTRALLVEP